MFQETHGCSRTRLYHIWRSMKDRCSNRNFKYYHRYGGRGISVCDEWNNDFLSFKSWAEDNGYNEEDEFGKLDLDRIDNNGNYEPSNCRFVSRKINCNNKGNNVIVEYHGERLTMMDLCRKLDIPYARTAQRYKSGKSIEESVARPSRYVIHNHFGG